jgi:hypothetical protein
MAQALHHTGRTFAPPKEIECADVTARKAHQFAVVAVALLGLLLGGAAGAALLLVDGLIMAVGRFWGPADVFRQVVWRVAEPRGWLRPNPVPEERGTRRIARVLGGLGLLAGAGALYAGNPLLAAVITVPLSLMILLDATLNFCALCFLRYQAQALRYRLRGA